MSSSHRDPVSARRRASTSRSAAVEVAPFSDAPTSTTSTTSTPVTTADDLIPPSIQIAKTFYRKTGALFLNPRRIALVGNQYDAEIWSLLAPAMIALVLEPIQMAVETSVVGHLGVSPLGAVGFGTVIFQFALGLFAAFIIATTTLVASCKNDPKTASQVAAQGMWVACIVGIALQAAVWTSAPFLLHHLSSDAEVAGLAAAYLRHRSFGIPAALVMMVAIGTARGHKNMAAPLFGSAAYGISLAFFDLFLIFGMGAGVEGAGTAAAISQWIGCVAIIAWLVKRQEFDAHDLLLFSSSSSPSSSFLTTMTAAAKPYAEMFPSLALNNVAALLPMLVATSLATSLGPDALAAHSVLRQLCFFWLQGFLAFNATAHSMVASALGGSTSTSTSRGSGRMKTRAATRAATTALATTTTTSRRAGMERAAGLLERICQLALLSSIPVAITLFLTRSMLPWVFTTDADVATDVVMVLPFLLACMPLDALGISLEGGILGAADTKWIAKRTAVASGLSLAALVVSVNGMHQGLGGVWGALKLLSVTALGCDLVRFLAPGASPSRTRGGSR